MILNGKYLKRIPYRDSRGTYGTSGQLYIAEDIKGTRFLVKTKSVDAANEYVAHRIAKLIGVPTSDAVLIKENNDDVSVGIKYEQYFTRVSMDDFRGSERYKNSEILLNGEQIKHAPEYELKYPDDSPFLADLMAYMCFRRLIVLEDNPQLAFARNRLISFDYAESFYLTEESFGAMLMTKDISIPLSVFCDHLLLDGSYISAIEVLRRPDTDFLIDAFLAPLNKFEDTNLDPILADLDAVFPPVVSDFYGNCFEAIRRAINS